MKREIIKYKTFDRFDSTNVQKKILASKCDSTDIVVQ